MAFIDSKYIKFYPSGYRGKITYQGETYSIDPESKLNTEEKCRLQEDLFRVGACWNNGQRIVIEEGTDNSVGYYFIYPNRRITYLQKDRNVFDYTFDRIVDKDIALNLLRYRIFLK